MEMDFHIRRVENGWTLSMPSCDIGGPDSISLVFEDVGENDSISLMNLLREAFPQWIRTKHHGGICITHIDKRRG